MKTRLNLEFFLAKRGRSLRAMCKNNDVSTLEQLHSLLDDLSVEYPDNETAEAALKEYRASEPGVVKEYRASEPGVVKEYRAPETKERKSGKRSKQKTKR
jgi:hypothetical protein